MKNKKTKQEKLENKVAKLSFWKLLWPLPIKGVIVLSIIATIIAFPINLIAGFVCLGATVSALTINGINYAISDKVDALFYEKIRITNEKIKDLRKEQTISYEEYKQQNLNASTLVVNYPNGEKSVSTIFRDKGPIVVEEEDTLNK